MKVEDILNDSLFLTLFCFHYERTVVSGILTGLESWIRKGAERSGKEWVPCEILICLLLSVVWNFKGCEEVLEQQNGEHNIV